MVVEGLVPRRVLATIKRMLVHSEVQWPVYQPLKVVEANRCHLYKSKKGGNISANKGSLVDRENIEGEDNDTDESDKSG